MTRVRPAEPSRPAPDAYAANLLGALGVGLTDAQAAAMTIATGLDISAVAALTTLLDRPGLTLRQLSHVLALSHSGAGRLADRLAHQGLLVRGRSNDGRQTPVTLTSAGSEQARVALSARRDTLITLLDRLTADERHSFKTLLTTVLGALGSDQSHARHVCRLCEHARCRGADCPVGTAAHPPNTIADEPK